MKMRDVYRWMLQELRTTCPHTIKAPGRFGGYVRIPVVQNPDWYRSMCEAHKSARRRYPKPRTIIKRKNTLLCLEKLASGKPYNGVYSERVKAAAADAFDFIRERMEGVVSEDEHQALLAKMPEF